MERRYKVVKMTGVPKFVSTWYRIAEMALIPENPRIFRWFYTKETLNYLWDKICPYPDDIEDEVYEREIPFVELSQEEIQKRIKYVEKVLNTENYPVEFRVTSEILDPVTVPAINSIKALCLMIVVSPKNREIS